MFDTREAAELEAPCRWCGYNSEDYWQSGTHSDDCPWHRIGGSDKREAVLSAYRAVLSAEIITPSVDRLKSYKSEQPVRYARTDT